MWLLLAIPRKKKEEVKPKMPARKVQKADIVQAALEILKTEDFSGVTARRLAEMLDCSVQPIYGNFASMDELEQEVLNSIKALYYEYMNVGAHEPLAYKGMGLAYIRFARDYPSYFKILFMGETRLSANSFIEQDSVGERVIERGMEMTGFSYEQQKQVHLKVWIFTHGLATLVATSTVQFDDREIEHLLAESVRELITGIKISRPVANREPVGGPKSPPKPSPAGR